MSTPTASTVSEPDCRLPVSFELFPPRTDAAALALGRTIDRLAEADPAFISVTYGAGGSSSDHSLTVLRYILGHTRVQPMAHLTCVGSSHSQANALVRAFLDAGITSFLALRGDLPQDLPEGVDALGDLRTAAELVQLIHRVQEERQPYGQTRMPGFPRASRIRERPRPERVAVAAFPSGHPRSHNGAQDIDVLLAKQVAGANLAITQLFFHADDFLGFVERARAAGVTMDILPGIMPVTSPKRLARLAELTGEQPPSELAIELEIEPTAQGQFEIGVGFATRLASEIIAGGADGLHIYTYNQHEVPLAVLERLGLATPHHLNRTALRTHDKEIA